MLPKITRNKSLVAKFILAVSFGGMAGAYLSIRNNRVEAEKTLKSQ